MGPGGHSGSAATAVNIGMCARAMANFGLDDLRLVIPARVAAHRRLSRRRLFRGGGRDRSARRRAGLFRIEAAIGDLNAIYARLRASAAR